MLINRHFARGVWLSCATVLCLALSLPVAVAGETARATPPQATVADTREPLRVVKFNDYAQTDSTAATVEETMLSDFARNAGVEVEWINVFRSAEALELILSGAADLSISGVPIDQRDDPRLLSSEPIGLKRFRIIARQGETADSPLGLAGKSVAVKLSSPMWSYLDRLRGAIEDLRLQVLPDDLSRDETLQMVSDGIYDAALVATEAGDTAIEDFPRTKYLFDLTGPQPVAWFARADETALVAELNAFIARFHTAYNDPEARLRSFDEAKRQGRLRIITRLDGQNYFLKRGRPAGFELGLARRFAKRHGLRLEVLVARDDEQIVQWLRNGVGDIVTARLDADAVYGDPGYTMSRDYRFEAAVLVSRGNRPLASPEQLTDTTLGAYEASANLEAVRRFAGDAARIVPIGQTVTLPRVLEHLENGTIDGAVIDGRHLDKVLAAHPDLVAGMSIPNPFRYRWTLRGDDPTLAVAVDAFMQSAYRQETYNVLERRYGQMRKTAASGFNDISPFDELLRDYADRYRFDWRLIAAQMYQESHFDPDAVSEAGALGLMQLMPATAQSLGVNDPRDPEAGIHAGVKYLNRLRDRFENRIPMSSRTWFALAAYNIGYDRVRRARTRARERGLDPDRWFGHVELAMREMSQPGPKFGCRCGQAITYVRSIRSLYYAYRNIHLASASPAYRQGLKTRHGYGESGNAG
ncbi:MAG: transglycosylase SLT domain-containing protein [Gammaproteobacteria bacterium]